MVDVLKSGFSKININKKIFIFADLYIKIFYYSLYSSSTIIYTVNSFTITVSSRTQITLLL